MKLNQDLEEIRQTKQGNWFEKIKANHFLELEAKDKKHKVTIKRMDKEHKEAMTRMENFFIDDDNKKEIEKRDE